MTTIDEHGCTMLHHAAHQGLAELCRKLAFCVDADTEARDKDGRTPLMYAAAAGHAEAVRAICHSGAHPNLQDYYGKTALLHAVLSGNIETVRELCWSSTHKDVADNDGTTALIAASARGHRAIVERLIEKGAMRWQHDKTGQTALMWAKANGHAEVLTILEKLEAEDEAYWVMRMSEYMERLKQVIT